MPKVTNNASSMRGLNFRPEPKEGAIISPGMIERVRISPGETVDVDEKFLASPGAKALIECGDLSLGGATKPKPEAEAPEPEAATSDEVEDRGGEKKGKGKGKKGKGGK